MEKYRIVRFERYDKKGDMVNSYFYIEKSRKILGRTFWFYVTANTGYSISGGSYRERIQLGFITEAQTFIENILVQGKPYDTSVTQVIQVY